MDLNWQYLADVYLHMCDVHLDPPKTWYVQSAVIRCTSDVLEPSHLHVWMSHKPSWAAFYPGRSASRCFLDLWAPQNVSRCGFIAFFPTVSTVMSAQAYKYHSAHQTERCLSRLFQLYFSSLRCRRGTCFLDNAILISPFFQVPLIWADMKTLHVYFSPPT